MIFCTAGGQITFWFLPFLIVLINVIFRYITAQTSNYYIAEYIDMINYFFTYFLPRA
jgi:hypothetical protein